MKKVVLYSSVFAAMMAAAPIAANAAAPEVAEVSAINGTSFATVAEFKTAAEAILNKYGLISGGTMGYNVVIPAFNAKVAEVYSNVDFTDPANLDLRDALLYALTSDSWASGPCPSGFGTVGQLYMQYKDTSSGDWDWSMPPFIPVSAKDEVEGAWDTVVAKCTAAEAALEAVNTPAGPTVSEGVQAVTDAFANEAVAEWKCEDLPFAAYVDAYDTDALGVQTFIVPEFVAFDAAREAFFAKAADWAALVADRAAADAEPSEAEIAEYEQAATDLLAAFNTALDNLKTFAEKRDAEDLAAYNEMKANLSAIRRVETVEVEYSFDEATIYSSTNWFERRALARFLDGKDAATKDEYTPVDGKYSWTLTYDKIAEGIERIYSETATHANHNLAYLAKDVVLQLIADYKEQVKEDDPTYEDEGNLRNDLLNNLVVEGADLLDQAKKHVDESNVPDEAVDGVALPGVAGEDLADYYAYHTSKLAELKVAVEALPAGLDKESDAYKTLIEEVNAERENILQIADAFDAAQEAYNAAIDAIVPDDTDRVPDHYVDGLPVAGDFAEYTGASVAAQLTVNNIVAQLASKYAEIEAAKEAAKDGSNSKTLQDVQDAVDAYNALVEQYDDLMPEMMQANDDNYGVLMAALQVAREEIESIAAGVQKDRSNIVAQNADYILAQLTTAESAIKGHYDNVTNSFYGDFKDINLGTQTIEYWKKNLIEYYLTDVTDEHETAFDGSVKADLDLDKVVEYVDQLNEILEGAANEEGVVEGGVDPVPTEVTIGTNDDGTDKVVDWADLETNAVAGVDVSAELAALAAAETTYLNLVDEADEDLYNYIHREILSGYNEFHGTTAHIEDLLSQIEQAVSDYNDAIQAVVDKAVLDEYINSIADQVSDLQDALDAVSAQDAGTYASTKYGEDVPAAKQAAEEALAHVNDLIDDAKAAGKIDEAGKKAIEDAIAAADEAINGKVVTDADGNEVREGGYAGVVADANANEAGHTEIKNAIAAAQDALDQADTEANAKIAELEGLKKGDGSLEDAVLDQVINNAIEDIEAALEEVQKELDAVKAEAEEAYNAGNLKDDETVEALKDKLTGYDHEVPVLDEEGNEVLDEDGNPETETVHEDGINEKIDALDKDIDYIEDRVNDIETGVYVVGNVDGDTLNMIDEFDFLALAEAVLEGKSVDELPAGDLDLDGELTIQDVKNLISWVGYHEFGRVQAPSRRPKFEGEIALESNGNNIALALNSNIECSAIQFDVTVPEGASIADFVLSNRANGLNVATNKIGTDKYRVLVLSFDGTGIEGTEGALVNFNVNGVGEVLVDNVITAGDRATRLNAAKVAVSGITTGIADATVNTTSEAIFGLNGVRFNTLQQGINIVNGKKIVK